MATGAALGSAWAWAPVDADAAIRTAVVAWWLGSAPGGGQTFTETGSGGAVFAGTVAPARVSVPVASGGAVLAGTGAVSRVAVALASGGAALGGQVSASKVANPAISGGFSLAGTVQVITVRNPAVAGGFALLGNVQPTLIFRPNCYGGLLFGGSAAPAAPDLPYSGPVTVANPSIPAYSGGTVNVGASVGKTAARMQRLAGRTGLDKLRGKR